MTDAPEQQQDDGQNPWRPSESGPAGQGADETGGHPDPTAQRSGIRAAFSCLVYSLGIALLLLVVGFGLILGACGLGL